MSFQEVAVLDEKIPNKRCLQEGKNSWKGDYAPRGSWLKLLRGGSRAKEKFFS